jgi:hypothetical protein
MDNYHPILMQFHTQTSKNMLNSKVAKQRMIDRFQDGRHRYVWNSSACYKMGNYYRTSMKFGTQTKTDMLSSKVIKAGANGEEKTGKIKCKYDIV